jgi:hypothetical protein
MANQVSIVKNKPKPLSQDYEQLRQLGLKYIEQFSKDIWTDYNLHDPGITTLEILNYVITDLAYRTSMPIEDILARINTDTTKDFFTAREILPCNPVTFDDLRKKIIDIEGVENAWVLPYTDEICASPLSNPAYYVKCNSSPKSIDLNAESQTGYEVRNINGLYKFNLLLEEDAALGDLNILSVDWEMRDSTTGVREALVRFIFPLDTEKTYPGIDGVVTAIENISGGTITNYTVSNFDAAKNSFDLILNCSTGNVSIEKVAFHIQPVHTNEKLSDLKTALKEYLDPQPPPTIAQRRAMKAEVNAKIFSVFAAKVKKVSSIIDEVYCMYQHVRNLCEDVIKIGVVPSQEIALCADIETDNAVDLEDILGEIYFAVDTFFSPPVRFYLLKELCDKGVKPEIIFEGPLLKHGFIQDDDLQKTSLFSEVHVSDLYNLIMSIEGVKTIRYLQITNYLNGLPQTDGVFWKLNLVDKFHLNLDRLRSKIIFYKGNMPIIADRQVANRIYNDLKATIAKPRINPDLKPLNDILPPVGTPYQLDEYYSAQNDFPFVYGINRDGIPSDADIIRKTKIKQLKGYLLFFDQMLANYLSQLAQLKNLFAIGSNNNQTYFSQPVYDTPVTMAEDDSFYSNPPANAVMPDSENQNFHGTAPLLKDFATEVMLEDVNVNIDDTDTYATAWKTFANNKKNNYRQTLNKLADPVDDKLDRRNRFLDHLLARFAESFTDYAVMMYKFTGNVLESGSIKTAQEIADDKYNFLKNYHILSYNRGKGQYYKCCPTGNCEVPPAIQDPLSTDDILEFDTYTIPEPDNPTGLHKRTTLMLGMNIINNADLAFNKFAFIEIPAVAPSTIPTYKFSVLYDATHSLDSVNEYAGDSMEEANKKASSAMEKLVTLIMDENNPDTENTYFEVNPVTGGYRIEVKETPTAAVPYAVSSPVYTNVLDAQEGIKLLKKVFGDEGMHVIDHLLLRPLPVAETVTAADLTEGFFPLCAALNPDCDCPITDYYSFRISIVLPYWTERFRNMDFRAFAEETIHRETPAHILPKFCWVSMYDMNRLEIAYNDWFAENRKYKPDMVLLKVKLKELIKTLNTLTNVYPEGHLHDCENPGTDNPVILDQTSLGTF